MSLNKKELNCLSVLKLRKLNFIPDHFSKISIDFRNDIKMLDHWINFNLNSRYAIKKTIALDQNKKMIDVIVIGLEDPRELSLLFLGCPYIHKKE